MNALWITRMCAYKNAPESLASAHAIVSHKIHRQGALVRRYGLSFRSVPHDAPASIGALLLEEARAAKQFWEGFKALLPAYPEFQGRVPHGTDTVNRLLDIGYRHLTGTVSRYLEARSVPADLGLMHVAGSSDAEPLAYDLVELFRSDIVDAEVLRFLRLKKRPRTTLAPRDIAHFVHEVNERMERQYYLKGFRRCHAYRYYMELQILRFISAINHGEVFVPIHLPTRHESRCLTK